MLLAVDLIEDGMNGRKGVGGEEHGGGIGAARYAFSDQPPHAYAASVVRRPPFAVDIFGVACVYNVQIKPRFHLSSRPSSSMW